MSIDKKITQLNEETVAGASDVLAIVDLADNTTKKITVENLSASLIPAGSDGSLQFNDDGSFAGSAGLTFDSVTNTLNIGSGISGDINFNSTGISGRHNIFVANQIGVDADGDDLGIVGANGNGAGDGGGVSIAAGDGGIISGNGGEANLRGGNAGDIGQGGLAIIQGGGGGNTSGNGGDVHITAGNAGAGSNGGVILLQPGIKDGIGTDGYVAIQDPSSGLNAIFNTSLLSAIPKTFTFPNNSGTFALTSDILTGLTVGTSTISSGTTTRILYDNAGVLGEYTISGSGTVVAMANVATLSSLVSIGTITTGVWNGTAITNAYLANSSLTIGSTTISLGATSTTLAGLTSVTSTTFVGALTGNATTATALATGRTISISGDLTYTSPSFNGSGNVTAASTLATVNGNVGTFGSATQSVQFTVNGKGLITAAANVTVTPAVGSITGLGSGIATWLATPSSANLLSAQTDKTGTGLLVFGTSPTLTTAVLGSSTATTQTPGDNSTKLATTAYVDAAVLGQNFKEAVGAATTANLVGAYLNGSSGVGATFVYTATGVDTIDGVTLILGMRVLLKNQTSSFQNGIYTVTTAGAIGVAGILTRATDANQSVEYKTGDSVFVTAGTTLTSTTWAYTGADSPTIGTDALTYAQVAGQGSFTAGNGITITGTSIAIDTSITVDKTTAQTLTNKTLTSPIMTAPALGTPTSGIMTNVTGLPAAAVLAGTLGAGAFSIGATTFTGNLTTSTVNIVTDTTTGTKFATATNQKIGFYNSTPIVQPTGDVITGLQNLGLMASATILATTITSRTLWGQTYDGSGNVSGSLTAVANITGGASSMTITAGTGNSRTLALQSTTSGGTATTFLTGNADQTVTFASGATFAGATTIGTGNAFTTGTIELGAASDTTIARSGAGAITVEGVQVILSGAALGTPSSGTLTNVTGLPAAGVVNTAMTLSATQTITGQKNFNNFINVNNAITASANAATVPVTFRLNTVTNNSAATLTITMTTTSAIDGQLTMVRILDFSAVAQTITWVNTENSTATAPTTSNGSTTLFLTVGFIYNDGTSKWRCIASA